MMKVYMGMFPLVALVMVVMYFVTDRSIWMESPQGKDDSAVGEHMLVAFGEEQSSDEEGSLGHLNESIDVPNSSSFENSHASSSKDWLHKKEDLVIVANGGSATAGAGCHDFKQRYYSILANRIKKQKRRKVKVVDSGHGGRNTYDSAILFDSYIPDDADIIIWEFAINDVVLDVPGRCCSSDEDLLFEIELYFNQVAKHPNNPSVIMLYLFDSHFAGHFGEPDHKGRIWGRERVFETISAYARKQPNYLGEFNFGQWVHEHYDTESSAKQEFMADAYHPNCQAHKVIGGTLYNVLFPPHVDDEKKQTVRQSKIHSQRQQQRQQVLRWPCGVVDPGAKLLKERVFNKPPPNRAVSWTLETPQFGLDRLKLVSQIQKDWVVTQAKQMSYRSDRKNVLKLQPCPSTLEWAFDGNERFTAIHWHGENVTLMVNRNQTTGTFVDASTWTGTKCDFALYPEHRYQNFFVFQNPTKVRSVSLCGNAVVFLALL